MLVHSCPWGFYLVVLPWASTSGIYHFVGLEDIFSYVNLHFGSEEALYLTHTKLQYTELIIWGIVSLLLKVIILLQYLQLFTPAGVRDFTFWASHVLLWANVSYYVAFTFLQMFSCSPRQAWWDKTIMPHKCLDIFAINVSGAVICLFSDLTILLLPQRVVLKLNISRRKKIGVCFLFAIGVL